MDKRIPKFLIEEDVIHLKISCHSPREHALLEFLYCTGCRVGEVQKLNIEDINWENCSAIVNGKGSKQGIHQESFFYFYLSDSSSFK